MTNTEKMLNKLGFSKNEITIYLALFDLGKCKAGELIDYTKLHRNLVYTALDEFVKRELVTKTEANGVATFVANDPNRLIEEIDQKRELAQQLAEEIKKKQEETPREVTIYEGLEGLKRATKRTLSAPEGETVYVFGAAPHSTLPDLSVRWRQYDKSRIQRGIHFKGLYGRTTAKDILDDKNLLPLTEAKYMPQGIEVPMWFNVCGDISSIVAVDDSPLAFNIKSKTIADGLKKYFEYLWNQDVSIVRGVEALKKTFYSMIDEVGPGGEYAVLGAVATVDEVPYLDEIFEAVHTYRIKKKVHVNMLVYKEYFERMKKRFVNCGDPHLKISHLKPFLTQPPSPFQINLYNGKALLIFYGEEPTIISFEKPEVYEGFKSYFDELWNRDSQTLQGYDGIVELCERVLEEKKDLYLIGANGAILETHEKYYQDFTKRRIQKNIKIQMLADEKIRGDNFTQMFLTEVKYLPSEFGSPMVVWIFGNYIAHVLWHEPQNIFLLQNPKVAEYYRNYYEALKKIAKK